MNEDDHIREDRQVLQHALSNLLEAPALRTNVGCVVCHRHGHTDRCPLAEARSVLGDSVAILDERPSPPEEENVPRPLALLDALAKLCAEHGAEISGWDDGLTIHVGGWSETRSTFDANGWEPAKDADSSGAPDEGT